MSARRHVRPGCGRAARPAAGRSLAAAASCASLRYAGALALDHLHKRISLDLGHDPQAMRRDLYFADTNISGGVILLLAKFEIAHLPKVLQQSAHVVLAHRISKVLQQAP